MTKHVEYGEQYGRVSESDLDAVSWPSGVSVDSAKALLREVRATLSLSLRLTRDGFIKVHVGICKPYGLGIELWLDELLNPDGGHDPALEAALERELTEAVEELRARREQREAAQAVWLATARPETAEAERHVG